MNISLEKALIPKEWQGIFDVETLEEKPKEFVLTLVEK